MKTIRKPIAIIAGVCTTVFLSSCGGSSTEHKHDDAHSHEHAEGEHEHIYACPMHPEVTGKEGDKCSKCGMTLEHNDNAKNSNVYFMDYVSVPATIEAGKKVTLSFTPKVKGKETEQVPLEVVHDKKIHLIIASKDLSWFDHIHPEFNSDGSYRVTTSFPKGGDYVLYADYAPSGSNHQLERTEINVTGEPYTAKEYTKENLTAKVNGYEVTLVPETGFKTNEECHIGAIIKQDGKEIPAGQLENYLGAKAHMVVISADSKKYLHVHPDIENNRLHLATFFEQVGIYRGWLQFQRNGKIHTADFVINVLAGGAVKKEAHSHGEGDHKH